MNRKSWLILFLGVALAMPAFARRDKSLIPDTDDSSHRGEIARAAQEKAGQRFSAADADKNGRLTREEVASQSQYMAANFEKHDKDGDGTLSWQEFVGHDRWEQPGH